MYNYLKKRLYEKYKTVTGVNSNITNFYDDDGYLVATLYRKEQVLNIFLSCLPFPISRIFCQSQRFGNRGDFFSNNFRASFIKILQFL